MLLNLKSKRQSAGRVFCCCFFTPAVESNECKVVQPTGSPSLSDFKPVKPSTDCASVLTMASKLSKLQCFSTCLSAASSASEAWGCQPCQTSFLFPLSLPRHGCYHHQRAFQTPNFVPLSPIVPLPHYPAEITLSFCCAIKLQPGEDWQCFSAAGGGRREGANQCFHGVWVCVYVCARACVLVGVCAHGLL